MNAFNDYYMIQSQQPPTTNRTSSSLWCFQTGNLALIIPFPLVSSLTFLMRVFTPWPPITSSTSSIHQCPLPPPHNSTILHISSLAGPLAITTKEFHFFVKNIDSTRMGFIICSFSCAANFHYPSAAP